MSWNANYLLLMTTSIVITYLSGLLIDRSNRIENKKKRIFLCKLWVALSFSSNLAILFFFKYFNFAIANINHFFFHIGIQPLTPSFDVLLPVGISFYTFQALGYTMDVYRNEIYAEKNLAKYALFVSFFPQLVAGPIERSKNLLIQINEKHYFNHYNMKNGLLLMLWGYFQKLVVADRIAIMVNDIYENYAYYFGCQIVMATVLFSIQIYCDFSGYSDIAKGAAQIMGFHLIDNFHQPYFAISIQDFWKRWHVSLSTWFRDYLYIPLGGNRCSKLKKYRNIIITFLASGLWHGASWNYILWGGLHGSYQIISDAVHPYKDKLYRKLKINTKSILFKYGQTFITFVLVDFAWIFFRASGAFEAIRIIKRIFLDFGLSKMFTISSYFIGLDYKDLFVAGFSILILILINFLQTKLNIRELLAQQNLLFRWVCYYVMILYVLILGIYGSEYEASQFIYFQF